MTFRDALQSDLPVIVEIYNSLGELVKILDQNFSNNVCSIDVSHYENGLYVLKIVTFNNQVFTQKLIINH